MNIGSSITFDSAEREYNEAWSAPSSTRFELLPVDANKVLKERYRVSPKRILTRAKDVNVKLQEENHQLKVHIAELEAARSSDASADDPLGVVPLLRALKDTPSGSACASGLKVGQC